LQPVRRRLNLFFTCQPPCQQRAADINAPLLLMQSVAGVVASVVDPDPERVPIHFGLLHGTGSRRAKMNKKVKKFQVLKF
jgi:hypothetical protein